MKLSKREKYAVVLAGLFVCIFVAVQFIYVPFTEKQKRLENSLSAQTKRLEKMILLKAEYDSLMSRTGSWENRLKKKSKGFTLFSFLDKLAGDVGLKEKIAYMKPSKSDQKNSPYKLSMVEMKLQRINLKQLTPYLHTIESSENDVYIRRLSITKKGKGQGFIDVVLQVETLEM